MINLDMFYGLFKKKKPKATKQKRKIKDIPATMSSWTKIPKNVTGVDSDKKKTKKKDPTTNVTTKVWTYRTPKG